MKTLATLLLLVINHLSFGQTMLDHLNEYGIEKGNKYAFVKFPDNNVPKDKNGAKDWPLFSQGGAIMIPALVEKTILDTITFELEYSTDSTICTNRNIHSIQAQSFTFISPSLPDEDCLMTDTTEGYEVYQIAYNDLGIIHPLNITITSRKDCEAFSEEISKDIHIEEYTYKIQPELKWIPLEKWDVKGKVKLDMGIMCDAYEDEKGNQYLFFEEGYYSDIRQIYCHVHISGPTVTEVQQVLKEKGYDVEVNNIMNKKTKAALTQFQKDNHLPTGNLDKETLDALGLWY